MNGELVAEAAGLGGSPGYMGGGGESEVSSETRVGERPETHMKRSGQRHHGHTLLSVRLSQWSLTASVSIKGNGSLTPLELSCVPERTSESREGSWPPGSALTAHLVSGRARALGHQPTQPPS